MIAGEPKGGMVERDWEAGVGTSNLGVDGDETGIEGEA